MSNGGARKQLLTAHGSQKGYIFFRNNVRRLRILPDRFRFLLGGRMKRHILLLAILTAVSLALRGDSGK